MQVILEWLFAEGREEVVPYHQADFNRNATEDTQKRK